MKNRSKTYQELQTKIGTDLYNSKQENSIVLSKRKHYWISYLIALLDYDIITYEEYRDLRDSNLLTS